MKKILILCLFAVCLATAQKKQSLAVLPCIGDFDPKGLERLRGKVEEVARDVLPPDSFRLIPYKNVREEIGDEDLFNACREGGSCFGDLAGKANADYGAWCMVNRFGDRLVLSFQLYDVGEKDILYTREYDSYKPKNDNDMIDIIKSEVPKAFNKMAGLPDDYEPAGKNSGLRTKLISIGLGVASAALLYAAWDQKSKSDKYLDEYNGLHGGEQGDYDRLREKAQDARDKAGLFLGLGGVSAVSVVGVYIWF